MIRPIGSGDRFCGVYHRPSSKASLYLSIYIENETVWKYHLTLKHHTQVVLYERSGKGAKSATTKEYDITSPELKGENTDIITL